MIKIFGEARSGTTYLAKLLELNGADVMGGSEGGWKHGFPVPAEGALHVLLMRDVYEWTRSMLTGFDARFSGLKEQFGGDAPYHGTWDNLIECRTYKYQSYIKFGRSAHNTALLSTQYLKEHPEVIMQFTGITEVEDINRHVRLGIKAKDDPNRPELTDAQKQWIDSETNTDIESFVDNLTIQVELLNEQAVKMEQ